jgi:GGDEF domain-containing protein
MSHPLRVALYLSMLIIVKTRKGPYVKRNETVSAIAPLLRHRLLRAILLGAPGITAIVAILTAAESNLVLAIVLNAAAGIVMSIVLFLAISLVARQVTNERVGLVQAAEQGFWHARAQRLSIRDENGLYTDWYIRLRLQEEIERSQRYGLHFSVLVLKPLGLHQDAELFTTGGGSSDRISQHLRRSDMIALLRDGGLAILLPNTGRRAAATVRRRLTKALASAEAQVGLACFPADGDASGALLTAAAAALGKAKSSAA